jgi:uncharacterized protein YggE
MSEDRNMLNVVLTVALIAILAMNGFLIYRMYATASPQPYTLKLNSASQPLNTELRVIHVSGTGTASAKPNMAVIYLGIKTQTDTADKAQRDNAELMNKVLDALKAQGIPESDIETVSYWLTPLTTYPNGEEPKIVGYRCCNNIAVTVKDVSQTGKIIDVAVQSGVNEVSNIQFKVSDEITQELLEGALENAISDADRKAEVVSESLGVKILGPVEITVGTGYEPIPSRVEATMKAETPIIPGELKVTVNVQVSYQYQ